MHNPELAYLSSSLNNSPTKNAYTFSKSTRQSIASKMYLPFPL